MSNDKEYYRNKLREYANKVPAAVNNGSINVTRLYKDWLEEAGAALSNNRATVLTYHSLVKRYEEFK